MCFLPSPRFINHTDPATSTNNKAAHTPHQMHQSRAAVKPTLSVCCVSAALWRRTKRKRRRGWGSRGELLVAGEQKLHFTVSPPCAERGPAAVSRNPATASRDSRSSPSLGVEKKTSAAERSSSSPEREKHLRKRNTFHCYVLQHTCVCSVNVKETFVVEAMTP